MPMSPISALEPVKAATPSESVPNAIISTAVTNVK